MKNIFMASMMILIFLVPTSEAKRKKNRWQDSPSEAKSQKKQKFKKESFEPQIQSNNEPPVYIPKSSFQKKQKNQNQVMPKVSSKSQQLSSAIELSKQGQYEAAAIALYNLSRRSDFKSEKAQIKYVLGMMLLEMKMPQVAAFQFVEVIKMNESKYKKQAIQKLSVAADMLGDETILNYAISKVDVDSFPESERDMLNFRMGEIALKTNQNNRAIQLLSKVQPGSPYYNKALFSKGLALMETKQLEAAITNYKLLYSLRRNAGPVDTNKVAAQLGLARAYYQKQDWDSAIDAYSLIPRDHVMWHQSFFEQSWAMFRGARFRSAISNFQSLHSAYYEDFYIPESLLLRAIVYLYICKYEEMEKVLNMFEKIYGPVTLKIKDFLRYHSGFNSYYDDLKKALDFQKTLNSSYGGQLPYIVWKSIMQEGDVKRSLSYLQKITDEKDRIEKNNRLRQSPLGQTGIQIINSRTKNIKLAIGEISLAHLKSMQIDLKDFYEQSSFIRYEMINGQREVLKKKLTGREIKQNLVNEKMDREFYIQNGYEYYPFRGEYWLDEIGNFHYVGQQNCE